MSAHIARPGATPRRTVIGLAALALAAAALLDFALSQRPVARGQAALRYGEAVVLKGTDLGSLRGAVPANVQLWVYRDNEWWQEPVQVDEREGGAFVAAGNGTLDATDELVFYPAVDGKAAPAGSHPPGLDGAPWVHIEVTDPLAPDAPSHAYAYAAAAPPPAQAPAVTYDRASRLYRGAGYALGLAAPDPDGYFGLRELRLGTAEANLVDRLKIRGLLSALGFEQEITEENLGNLLGAAGSDLSADPVKEGPIRSLTGGGSVLYAQRMGLLSSLADLDALGGGVPGLDFGLKNGRLSLDLSAAAEGATYRDANLPAGVKVDGKADVVPASPLPAWRELSFPMGRLVFLSRPGGDASKATLYFKDDATLDGNDTGDGASWADQGVAAPDVASLLAAGFPGQVVVLPAGSPVSAPALAAQAAQPLTAKVVDGSGPPPTAVPTTRPSPQPTGGPGSTTPTVSASATPAPGDLQLTGQVTDAADGRPLDRARVSFQPCNPHQPFSALTGTDGSFALLIPRDYAISCGAQIALEVRRSGYADLKQTFPLVDLYRQPTVAFSLQRDGGGGDPAKLYIPQVQPGR